MSFSVKKKIIFVILLLSAVVSGAVFYINYKNSHQAVNIQGKPYEEGDSHLEIGEYNKSLKSFNLAAERGDADAQNALKMMHKE